MKTDNFLKYTDKMKNPHVLLYYWLLFSCVCVLVKERERENVRMFIWEHLCVWACVDVNMCVCVCTHMLCVKTRTCVNCVCMWEYSCERMCVHVSVFVNAYMRVFICVHMCADVWVNMWWSCPYLALHGIIRAKKQRKRISGSGHVRGQGSLLWKSAT